MTTQPGGPFGPFERIVIRVLLRLYPKRFRDSFEGQWLPFLCEQRQEDRYARRVLGTLHFWADVLVDLAVSRLRIRQEQRQEKRYQTRTNNGGFAMESLLLDLRFAFRTLARRPLFATTAILTLGLGIGAATAMFSVVDGVLLADSQYADPDRLMSIWQSIEGREGFTEEGETRLQYAQYEALRERSTAFDDVAVYAAGWGESTLSGGSRPELVYVGAATPSLLPVLGVTPALGRWFLPEEGGEGVGAQAQVTVLSHEMWEERYARDMNILGTTVVLNHHPHTVVGVLPPNFRMQWLSSSLVRADNPEPRDFWVPVGAPDWEPAFGSSMWEAVGRLAPGVTVAQATDQTTVILDDNWDWGQVRSVIHPRTEDETRGIGSPLLLLFGATGLLLLVACGNVAALALGEVQGRVHEMATRAAIGVHRWRIVRQLLTESLVLALAGSALGALVAVAGTKALVSLAPPMPRIDLVEVDLSVLAFAAAIGTLSGVLFGTAPALVTAREAAGTTLRSGGRGGSPRRGGLSRWVLTGGIGLTVMLLVASGLLVKSLSQLLEDPLGFDPESVASVEVSLPDLRYETPEARAVFMNEVLLEMETIAGVSGVTASNALPFSGSAAGWGSRANQADTTYVMPDGYHVAPGHLDFLGIPVIEGRGLLSTDDAESPPVVVVSQSLATSLWGDRSPVGLEMFYPMGTVTVVGVAGDVKQDDLHDRAELSFYVPFAQHARSNLKFAVRAGELGSSVLLALREAVWRVDGELAITDSGMLENEIRDSASGERYRTFLMSTFAVLATALAIVGIMGATARHVARRTREVGIRKALGAEDAALLGGVMADALRVGLFGIAIGLLGAFFVGPVMAAFLYGVAGFDLTTYAAVAIVILGVAALASYVPGRRILAVSPASVLREE